MSIVLICSSRTVDSVLRPLVIIATWVGRAAFVFLPVIAATMVVGLCLLPISFCKIKDGRVPPCSILRQARCKAPKERRLTGLCLVCFVLIRKQSDALL